METQTKTIKLDRPLRVGDNDVTELTMRQPLLGDMLDAYDMAPDGASNATVEAYLIAVLCRTPIEDLRRMAMPDYQLLLAAYNFLSAAGSSPARGN